jgi:uncharacterized protein (DUF58 family)
MRPTPRFFGLLALGFFPAGLPLLGFEGAWVAWIAAVAGLCFALGLDGLLGLSPRRLGLAIEAPARLEVGVEAEAHLRLTAPAGAEGVEVEVRLEADALLAPPDTLRLLLGPASEAGVQACRADAAVPLLGRRRGEALLRTAWLRWQGPLGLLARQRRQDLGQRLVVAPDMGGARAVAWRHFHAWREQAAGIKVERFVGEGSEFEALREYVPGLDSRALDWRATARHRKLICREHRAERNHQVVLALDTGHLMSEPLGGVPKLDHAVRAALGLAWMALRTGDRVGLCAFDAQPRLWAPPRSGLRSLPALEHATAGLAYGTQETNFTLGITSLTQKLTRRSLVVLLTDVLDTATADLMLDNLDRLARRHLLLFVALRDPGLDELVLRAPATLTSLTGSVVAAGLVRERDAVLTRLRRRGVLVVDAPPARVGPALLDRYLEVKRRELVA